MSCKVCRESREEYESNLDGKTKAEMIISNCIGNKCSMDDLEKIVELHPDLSDLVVTTERRTAPKIGAASNGFKEISHITLYIKKSRYGIACQGISDPIMEESLCQNLLQSFCHILDIDHACKCH